MNTENFAVLELPKENSQADSLINDALFFDDYDKAFDCFNEKIATESKQVFKQPKSPQPLRAALSTIDLELWVIKRSDKLIN